MLSDTLATRRRFALAIAAPALLATWGLGIALSSHLDETLLSSWVLGALALSIAAINVVLFAVAKDGRRGVFLGSIVFVLLTACVALMVWRPDI